MFIALAIVVVLFAFVGTLVGVRTVMRLLGEDVDGSAESVAPSDPQRALANAQALAAGVPENVRFDVRLRGYDPQQVDAVIGALIDSQRQLRQRLAAAGEVAGDPVEAPQVGAGGRHARSED